MQASDFSRRQFLTQTGAAAGIVAATMMAPAAVEAQGTAPAPAAIAFTPRIGLKTNATFTTCK